MPVGLDVDVSTASALDDYVSVAAAAAECGVSRQAMHQRVQKLLKGGLITGQGAGKSFRLHLPSLKVVLQAINDPAQAARNRHWKPQNSPTGELLPADPARSTPLAADPAPQPRLRPRPTLAIDNTPAPVRDESTYDAAKTREMHAKAERSELELAIKRAELVPVSEIAAAAAQIATSLVQSVTALKSKSVEFYAAARAGGEEALDIKLRQEIDATLKSILIAMQGFAATAPAESVLDTAAE